MISFLIPVCGQLSYTKQCLKSIFENVSYIKTPYEIIVCDNNSNDGTKEYLQGLESAGKIKAIYSDINLGFPKSNNLMVSKVDEKCEYLLLLNNDTITTKGFLEKLLRCIKSDHLLGAVGPWANHSSGYQMVIPQPPYRGEEDLAKYADKFSKEEIYVDFLVFFCALIKRKVWDEIGGLDPDFGRGCYEDNLFCYRLLEKGYKMKICGDAYVHHYSGKTFQQNNSAKQMTEYASLMARNQKIFLHKVNRYETVSLIMICSDREQITTLKNCLDSVREWVDQIVIVFNWKGYPKPWAMKRLLASASPIAQISTEMGISAINPTITTIYTYFTDFSAMRNLSLKMATGRYCLVLDADDIVQTPAAIRDLILKNPHVSVFKCRILSYTDHKTIETALQNRLFRNNPALTYVNRCHEDISYSMNRLNYNFAITDLTIKHYGYSVAKQWYKKNKRNLRLMQQDIDEIQAKSKPDDIDQGRLSMIYYGIVNALILIAGPMKDLKKQRTYRVQALKYCDLCIEKLKHEDPLLAKMWMLRGMVCLDAGEHLAAKQSFHKAHDEWAQPEATINLAEIYMTEKNWNKVIELLDTVMQKYHGAYPMGSLSCDPVQMHGLVLDKLGHAYANKSQACKNNPEAFDEYIRKAEGYYRESLNLRPSLEIANILIQVLRNTNRMDEAAGLALKTINRWPGYFWGWYYIGEFEQGNGRNITAKFFYRECLKLKPGHKEAAHNLKMLDVHRN